MTEAATNAVEDEMYGQDVGIAVRVVAGKKADAMGLRRWIRGRVLAYKVPKKVRDCSLGLIDFMGQPWGKAKN